MISIRKEYRTFSWGDFQWVDVGTKKVAAYTRNYDGESILVLNNLTDSNITINLAGEYQDLLTGTSYSPGDLDILPYQYLWLLPA
jgi:glycosidase